MHIKPKKSLGQNFLIDRNIQRKLIASYGIKPQDHILEIGAGYGELTRLIAAEAACVHAIEVDRRLYKALKENTCGYENVKLIRQDILSFDIAKHFKDSRHKVKVVGNIPYYITTPIIEALLKYRDGIESAFITVQKEFARRITASPGSKEYGSFSCFVQYYAVAGIVFYIKKNSFSPAPKVDSCLLELKMRHSPAVKVNDEELFFRIIRAGFNQRRKTLRNSLDGVIPAGKLNEFFAKYGIDNNIRPEDLALTDFARLSNLI